MMRIDISPEALKDLQSIRQIITADFGASTADRILRKILSSIHRLELFPDSGMDVGARYGIDSDYRCLITTRNYVFFRIENETVHVVRILNERQDFMDILFGIREICPDSDDYWDE